MNTKKAYSAPKLSVHGDVKAITLAARLDRNNQLDNIALSCPPGMQPRGDQCIQIL